MLTKRATKPKAKTDSAALKIAQLCAAEALDKKAENVLILDVSQLTSFTDYFVICSAPSERQASAIARHVHDEAKKAGANILGTEGAEEGAWVLIDLGDVVFHSFLDSTRDHYDLEGFWSDAKSVPLDRG
jgi:ribosome-associated protein